jgi:hypothetical protein
LEGEEGAAVTRFVSAIIGLVAAACQSPPNPQPAARSEPPPMNTPTPCRAFLTPAADGEFGVRFALSNPTSEPIALDTYQPFLQFRVRATAGGTNLAVTQPALDLPVQPVTLNVPAGGSLELVTPVRLRFQAQGAASQDRFVWSIAHGPKGVQLTFTLDLPPPFDRPFDTTP